MGWIGEYRECMGWIGEHKECMGWIGVQRECRRGSLTVPITTATTACVRLFSETSNRLLSTGELEKTMPFEYH